MCPSLAATVRTSTSPVIRSVAFVCRRECIVTRGSPARSSIFFKAFSGCVRDMGRPSIAVKSLWCSDHSEVQKSPRSNRSRSCSNLYRFSSSTKAGEIFVDRYELIVLGVSVYVPFFGVYCDVRRTVITPLSKSMSGHSSPNSSPSL